MTTPTLEHVTAAEVVLPCEDLDETVRFFVRTLGFRLDEIMPADAPTEVVVSGHGLRLRLLEGGPGSPGELRLACEAPDAVASGTRAFTAPNGTQIHLVDADPPVLLPDLDASIIVTKAPADEVGGAGRAGMLYRDLIPGRLGGRYIASHISVPDPGPVPDYVHFHRIHFQMIFCARGWVKVVYEDQGEPFILNAGDCVLQPPQIRHRVLEGSGAMEVVEISCPAEHITRADHELPLPTSQIRPDRDFGGQVFLRHIADHATWVPWRLAGYEVRDTGMQRATRGIARATVIRVADAATANSTQETRVEDEFFFAFVLAGQGTISIDGRTESLVRADSFVLPTGTTYSLAAETPDFEWLEVTVPLPSG